LKKHLLILFILISQFAKAQTVDSMFVNLYTDSLKKGTYNYINIDGLLSNGGYMPLDTAYLTFKSSAGKFTGNNLWIDADFKGEKVTVEVTLKPKPEQKKVFDIYIKQKPDGPLRSLQEVMDDMKKQKKKSKER